MITLGIDDVSNKFPTNVISMENKKCMCVWE